MKVTYIENLPLDGAGTMINPAYKWLPVERKETCGGLRKYGSCFYLVSYQGYVLHSVEAEKVRRMENGNIVADCSYNRMEEYPFNATFTKEGKHIASIHAKDLSDILQYMYAYQREIANYG